MRGADGEGIVLDWHLETAKWDHFPTMRNVEIIEGCFAERGGGGFVSDRRKGARLVLELSWGRVRGEGFGGGACRVSAQESC